MLKGCSATPVWSKNKQKLVSRNKAVRLPTS